MPPLHSSITWVAKAVYAVSILQSAGFVYQAEKVGFRQQEIIHGSVNFENYTLFSACAHEYNWQKTRQKIKNPTLNFTKCWISEV